MSKPRLISRLQNLEAQTRAASRTMTAEQKLARSALQDSEERLRAILETAVEGIITIDERGIIESFNPAAEKIFGYKAREIIRRNVSCLMPSPYRDEHDSYLAGYLRTGKAHIIGIGREVVGRRKDGTVFPMDLAVSQVRLAKKQLFAGFVRDITERRRLEKEVLEIADREQRRIGQDLHDGLCQQLAGIELMSQVLEQKLAAKSKSESARAGEIANHVRASISHTRLLARGLSPVALESEGLMSALRELAVNTEEMFQIRCRFECDSPVQFTSQAVATHLYRIAQEAVSNAIKHGKARRVLIQLEKSQNQATLTVKDYGAGFPKQMTEKKGMGLRIMRYRAGMIGGALELRNDAQGGASVICSVPTNREIKNAKNS